MIKSGWLPYEEWQKAQDTRIASAALLIENSAGELLTVKAYYKTHWSLPGGMVDAGETPLQAALRETQEEVGLVVTEEEVSFFAVASRSSDKGLAHQYIFRAVLDDARLERIVLQQSKLTLISSWVATQCWQAVKDSRGQYHIGPIIGQAVMSRRESLTAMTNVKRRLRNSWDLVRRKNKQRRNDGNIGYQSTRRE